MVTVSIRYWAGARAAAGVERQQVEASTLADALDQVREERADPRFDRVLAASSLLVDGVTAHPADLQTPLSGAVQLEVLPPFAGGGRDTYSGIK